MNKMIPIISAVLLSTASIGAELNLDIIDGGGKEFSLGGVNEVAPQRVSVPVVKKDKALEGELLKGTKEALASLGSCSRSLSKSKDTITSLKRDVSNLKDRLTLSKSVEDMRRVFEQLSKSIDTSIAERDRLKKKNVVLSAIAYKLEGELAMSNEIKTKTKADFLKLLKDKDELAAEVELLKLNKRIVGKNVAELRKEFSDIDSWANSIKITTIAVVSKKAEGDSEVEESLVAIVYYKGKIKTLEVGDYIYGWKVADISREYVTLSSNSRAYRFYIGSMAGNL